MELLEAMLWKFILDGDKKVINVKIASYASRCFADNPDEGRWMPITSNDVKYFFIQDPDYSLQILCHRFGLNVVSSNAGIFAYNYYSRYDVFVGAMKNNGYTVIATDLTEEIPHFVSTTKRLFL